MGQIFLGLNQAIGTQPLYQYFDPTAQQFKGGTASVTPAYIFWMLFTFVFCYLGANLPIWRFAQPVNYLGFWITAIVIVLSYVGGIVGFFTNPNAVSFKLPATTGFLAPNRVDLQPIWPMLFVTIACGAISGWHALFGSVGTARQLEYETDALPVGGGAMLFGENTLGLLSLIAISIAGKGAGPAAFASGVVTLLSQIFGPAFTPYGTALGFAAFVVIVITVVQLVFRLMRVTLGEWLGEAQPVFKNPHVASLISMALAAFLVLTGTWIYLWQLFGAANQLMAGLALLIVTVWLVSERRPAWYAGVPGVFMYVTTMAAILVTLWNQRLALQTSIANNQPVAIVGSAVMLILAALLFLAAAFIAYESWQAFNRWRAAPVRPAPVGGGE